MKSLKLIDGDLSFDSNKELEMVSDDEEYAQNLKVIMQTSLGEFELDETLGLDRTNLLTKQFDEELARADIVEALMQEDRTDEVSDLTFSQDKLNRELSIDLEVKKTDGDSVTVEDVNIDAG
ncbi:DUF2634 domain-containing protein [Heyndrickxia coagulans]|uniref:DUF2634 domain-containing protein n=1 Tax=Heyndrickxia coagulans TaxID=1398 RepID=UPI00145940E9|nr:DUF2634 domain-containing protein [Heyndrickxia coagulans]NMH83261.1 DUF2634 domain-containing protein [Heyndrickxia coagulans]